MNRWLLRINSVGGEGGVVAAGTTTLMSAGSAGVVYGARAAAATTTKVERYKVMGGPRWLWGPLLVNNACSYILAQPPYQCHPFAPLFTNLVAGRGSQKFVRQGATTAATRSILLTMLAYVVPVVEAAHPVTLSRTIGVEAAPFFLSLD